jgi:hypothetical protein
MAAKSEGESIREAVKKAALPGGVIDVSHRLDVDATGAPEEASPPAESAR